VYITSSLKKTKNQNLRVDVMRERKRKMGVGSPIYLFPFWAVVFGSMSF
jgi:hypothetical protein